MRNKTTTHNLLLLLLLLSSSLPYTYSISANNNNSYDNKDNNTKDNTYLTQNFLYRSRERSVRLRENKSLLTVTHTVGPPAAQSCRTTTTMTTLLLLLLRLLLLLLRGRPRRTLWDKYHSIRSRPSNSRGASSYYYIRSFVLVLVSLSRPLVDDRIVYYIILCTVLYNKIMERKQNGKDHQLFKILIIMEKRSLLVSYFRGTLPPP